MSETIIFILVSVVVGAVILTPSFLEKRKK